MVDEAIDIAADPNIDPKRARNMVNARHWTAERRLRKEYGQSLDVSITERVDLGGALIEARKRSALPGCDLAQVTAQQVTDYIDVTPKRATDTQTAGHNDVINPFD